MNTFPVFSKEQIEKKLVEIAQKINEHYGKEEVLAIGILKGAFVFYSDLLKHLTCPVICDFCCVSFYGNSAEAKSEAYLSLDISHTVKDRHVLIVDCIADCGNSLKYVRDHLARRQPKSLASAVLVSKPRASKSLDIEFSGFQVDQEAFIIGYGTDYKEQGRNLDYLAQVEDIN